MHHNFIYLKIMNFSEFDYMIALGPAAIKNEFKTLENFKLLQRKKYFFFKLKRNF